MHANEELLRNAYDAFTRGDLAGYMSLCGPDMHFVVPGENKVGGRYSLAELGDGLLAKVMEASGGTFRETVLDVYANDRGGIVRAHHELSRDGVPHAYQTLHIYEIRDGKLRSFLEVPEDRDAFERAWA